MQLLPTVICCRCEPERVIRVTELSQSTKTEHAMRFHTAATGRL